MYYIIPKESKVGEQGKEVLRNFFNGVNRNIDWYDREQIVTMLLFLVTGKKQEEINKGIYDRIYQYTRKYIDQVLTPLKEKMKEYHVDPIFLDITANGILKKIEVGDIKIESVYCKNFTKKELRENFEKGKNCCGSYPTMKNPGAFFLQIDDKFVMGNKFSLNNIDPDNIHFGPYYLNRNTISGEDAELTELEIQGENGLREVITRYDQEGKIKDQYINTMTLRKTKNGEYFVLSARDDDKIVSIEKAKNQVRI